MLVIIAVDSRATGRKVRSSSVFPDTQPGNMKPCLHRGREGRGGDQEGDEREWREEGVGRGGKGKNASNTLSHEHQSECQ